MLKDEDIEGDFNPEEHNKRMRSIFDEEYYGGADDEKPVFPDLDKELEIENWDEYEPGQEEKEAQDFSVDEPHCEDAEFNMDADYDPKSARANLLQEMKLSLGKKRRNRKNKSKLAKLLADNKPKFIPQHEDKTYAQYMEEYYKMDCEDVIGGDLPTRFKYREVVPNDYGLTIEEILLADDKELTQWVPLKKIVRHKPESVQKGEVNAYAQKAADSRLKRKVLPSLFKNLPEEPELVVSTEENSKKKKKKKKSKPKDTHEVGPENTASVEGAQDIDPNSDENNEQNGVADKVSEEKLVKKKVKRKNTDVSENTVKCSPVEHVDSSIEDVNESVEVNEIDNVVKETKKSKKKGTSVENGLRDVQVTENKGVEETKSELSKRQKKNLRKKIKKKGIIVEDVNNVTPSRNSQNKVGKKRKLSEGTQVLNKKQKSNEFNNGDRKKPVNKEENNKAPFNKEKQKSKDSLKKPFKNKDKFNNKKQNNDRFKNKIKQIIDKNKSNDNSDNPMNNLSDERLKAYGLNPKKYRSFLKYKKF